MYLQTTFQSFTYSKCSLYMLINLKYFKYLMKFFKGELFQVQEHVLGIMIYFLLYSNLQMEIEALRMWSWAS